MRQKVALLGCASMCSLGMASPHFTFLPASVFELSHFRSYAALCGSSQISQFFASSINVDNQSTTRSFVTHIQTSKRSTKADSCNLDRWLCRRDVFRTPNCFCQLFLNTLGTLRHGFLCVRDVNQVAHCVRLGSMRRSFGNKAPSLPRTSQDSHCCLRAIVTISLRLFAYMTMLPEPAVFAQKPNTTCEAVPNLNTNLSPYCLTILFFQCPPVPTES